MTAKDEAEAHVTGVWRACQLDQNLYQFAVEGFDPLGCVGVVRNESSEHKLERGECKGAEQAHGWASSLGCFKPYMNGTNAVHHVVVFAVDESCVLHHCEQSLLVGVHTNRLDEILVTVGVVGNDFACEWPEF